MFRGMLKQYYIMLKHVPLHVLYICTCSKDFRPAFDRIRDLRAVVPPHTPFLAATATVTKRMRDRTSAWQAVLWCLTLPTSPTSVMRSLGLGEDFALFSFCIFKEFNACTLTPGPQWTPRRTFLLPFYQKSAWERG